MSIDNAGKAVIETTVAGDDIVIRVPVSSLGTIVRVGCDMGYIHGNYIVENATEFAKDLVHTLNDEDEEGTTAIHKLFDQSIGRAIEQGAFGIAEKVCTACDNGGWVMNGNQPPPQFDECPECHNPLGLASP